MSTILRALAVGTDGLDGGVDPSGAGRGAAGCSSMNVIWANL